MPADHDRVAELEREVERLEDEIDRLNEQVDRYRAASEDSLQQLDWCIGYFTGSNKLKLAKSLSSNRSYIRRSLLKRAEAPVPTEPS
ncbi:MAG TPA: hypothetical protein VIP98_07360 [Microlunatus sp.]